VPAVLNARWIETLLLLPGMSAGVAASGVSNVTLCATAPNENVTLSPELMESEFGVNARPTVAATVFPAGGGGGGGGDWLMLPYGPVPPLQAASVDMNEVAMIRVKRDIRIQPEFAYELVRPLRRESSVEKPAKS
jgi:hypothetical protein